MSKKVKVSDVRQGVTLYNVHAFPHKGRNKSYIDAYPVTKRPWKSEHSNGLFAEARMFFSDELSTGSYTRQFSLRDAGIVPNSYNFHNTFSSLKKAQQYAARMNRQCLTAAERLKATRLNRNDREWRLFGV